MPGQHRRRHREAVRSSSPRPDGLTRTAVRVVHATERSEGERLWTVRLIVDGMNVIGSRPDGWWRDRAAARRRLVSELAGTVRARSSLPAAEPKMDITAEGAGPADRLIVVFDGRQQADEVARGAEAGLEVVFAPGGPDAADRVIAEMVRTTPDAAGTIVVTSDRALAREVRAAGATVLGAGGLAVLVTRDLRDERIREL